MLRATAVREAGSWSPAEARDAVRLDYDARHRRRIVLRGLRGLDFLLDLPKAVALRGGDGLLREDGGIVAVEAARERLLEVRSGPGADLLRIAWHLGNRHLPTQLLGDALRIREDHVIRDLLEGLGAQVRPVEAPFDPEGGAYGHGRVHDHGQGAHGTGHHHD